jgi:hypothetical protein
MEAPNLEIADLSEEQLAMLRELEGKVGAVVVAYKQNWAFADLTGEQVALLQDVERELGVTLLAYREK